ncbi:hypothetical protein [Pseudomonas aeruginosa]
MAVRVAVVMVAATVALAGAVMVVATVEPVVVAMVAARPVLAVMVAVRVVVATAQGGRWYRWRDGPARWL